MIVEFRLLPPDDGPHRVTRAAFFFELNKLLRQNHGTWEGYISALPGVLDLPITELTVSHRLRRHGAEHGVKMQYLNSGKTLVRLNLAKEARSANKSTRVNRNIGVPQNIAKNRTCAEAYVRQGVQKPGGG